MDNIYYQEERKYLSDRFFVFLGLTSLLIVYASWRAHEVSSKVMMAVILLSSLLLLSGAYHYFIVKFPDRWLSFRKYLLIFVDIAALSFLVVEYQDAGLFLLPIYILIVMRSGLSFGLPFFYSSLGFSALSWLWIVNGSPYWHKHYEIIATFAVTTFFIPFFYIQYIIRIHEENDLLSQTLDEVVYDATYDELTGVANRKRYKEKIQEWIKAKEPFALLFIDLVTPPKNKIHPKRLHTSPPHAEKS